MHLSTLIVDQDPSTSEEEQRQALVRALHSRVRDHTSTSSEEINAGKSVSSIRAPDVLIAPTATAFMRGKAAAKHAHPIIESSTKATEAEEGAEPTSNKRRKRNPLSPCGASLNWYLSSPATHSTLDTTSTVPAADPSRPSKPRKIVEVAGGTVEVTIAHTGALQGCVKKSVGEVSSASRLSPHAMRTLFEHTLQVLEARRHDSELHEKMYCEIVGTILRAPPGTHLLAAEVGAVTTITTSTISDTDANPAVISTSTVGLLSQVQQLSRRELKTRCGQCYYNSAKAQFLCHPVFKDWICDE